MQLWICVVALNLFDYTKVQFRIVFIGDSNDMVDLPRHQSLRETLLKPGFQDSCQAKPNADVDLDEKYVLYNICFQVIPLVKGKLYSRIKILFKFR